ncbi:MAG: hypothetical protein AB8B49_01380 [Nitratireductor sp.]
MQKISSFICLKFILTCLMFVGLSASTSHASDIKQEASKLRQYFVHQDIEKAKAYFAELDLKANANQILALSKKIKVPNALQHYIWAAAYHAYVADEVDDRQQVAFLLGEAGAQVSSESEQGLLFKEYMLDHFYINGRKSEHKN